MIIIRVRVRVARHTARLEETAGFYRDRLGFREVTRFRGHDGYDGIILAIPGAELHLELTGGGPHPPPQPHPESLLVLFFDGPEERDRVAAAVGRPPVQPANPFWRRHAVAFEDPDGFQVLLSVRD